MTDSIVPYRQQAWPRIGLGVWLVSAWLGFLSDEAWAQGLGGSQDGGMLSLLGEHLMVLQIACGVSALIFVICLIWEIWVAIQLRRNGGGLPVEDPEKPYDVELPKKDDTDKEAPIVLDETEDPFKALLNKASNEDSESVGSRTRGGPYTPGYGSSSQKEAPKAESSEQVLKPYENISPKKSSEHIARGGAGGFSFDGSATISMSSIKSDAATGIGFAPPVPPKSAGGSGFAPPKPAAGNIGFASPKSSGSGGLAAPSKPAGGGIGFAPPKPAGGGIGFAPPKPAAGGLAAPSKPAGGGIGFGPPKPAGGGIGFTPPKPPSSSGGGIGFAPPKPAAGGINFASPKSPGAGGLATPPKPAAGGIGFAPSKPAAGGISFASPKSSGVGGGGLGGPKSGGLSLSGVGDLGGAPNKGTWAGVSGRSGELRIGGKPPEGAVMLGRGPALDIKRS
ncbi:MAG: hypothetical protein K6A35_06945 [bacterium]|nr:hypothetical protein [bacterium]